MIQKEFMKLKSIKSFLSLVSILCLAACGGSHRPSHPTPDHRAGYVKVGFVDAVSSETHVTNIPLRQTGNRYVAASTISLPSRLISPLSVEVGLPSMAASENVHDYYPSVTSATANDLPLDFRDAKVMVVSDQVVYSAQIINGPPFVPDQTTISLLQLHLGPTSGATDEEVVEIPFSMPPAL
jgi:hypothetical protein